MRTKFTKLSISICLLVQLQNFICKAQINFTANDQVPAYNGPFSFGLNDGYWGPQWIGKTSDIIFGNASLQQTGIGATGIRYTLNNAFLEIWGYNIYTTAYLTDQQMGAHDNVLFLEKPSVRNHTVSIYCSGKDTLMFRDMYLPIWDNNANGTPVNDDNPYALYVYKTAIRYKNYIKFWEIWNEPDFTTSDFGWQDSTYANSWFNKDPDPCDLTNILSPVYSYNRLLRISYEVIKYVDSTAFVTTGGLGYAGFLDAVLRNTDNPDHGKITADYPLLSGAYFDVLSYHDYPQFEVGGKRHSDAAGKALIDHKNQFQQVLNKYGYNGKKYPLKHFIITETNVARQSFGTDFGGKDAQINFLLKAPVYLQASQVKQMYIYALAENTTASKATSTFDMMGLYENLSVVQPYQQVITTGGIAFKTAANLLYNSIYDPGRTASLNLPTNVGGGAFFMPDGNYLYVLWAITTIDNSETAAANFTFPSNFGLATLHVRNWDFSQTGSSHVVSSYNIALTGTPAFFAEKDLLAVGEEMNTTTGLKIFPNPTTGNCSISFSLAMPAAVTVSIFDIHGRVVKTVNEGTYSPAGPCNMLIPEFNLEPGTYYCQVNDGKQIHTAPLILMK